MVQDPLGLTRCAMCGNAFSYDADERTSGIVFPRGNGFVCRWCAPDLDIVGLVEIAGRLGVKRDTTDQWRARGLLPEPTWTVGGRPAWPWRHIEEWAERTGRIGRR